MALLKTQNPFKPTAGMNPPELIGREEVIKDFRDSIEMGVGAPYRLMRISGVRGTGKTVLLNAMAQIAQNEYGFTVVNVTSERGTGARIAEKLKQEFPNISATIEPEAFGVKLGSVSVEQRSKTLDTLMLEATKKRGLLVTIDEVQDIDLEELRSIANNVQLVIREEGNIAFIFAGLPTAIDDAVNHPGTTFLQRAASIELTRLDVQDVEDSYNDIFEKEGVTVCEGTTKLMAEASKGYAFMVQLVGFYTWQAAARDDSDKISLEHVKAGISEAKRSFSSTVLRPILSRLPKGQYDYLCAMMQCGEGDIKSGDVADKMGVSPSQLSVYRSRLIEAGILESAGYGKARIAIPYLEEHLGQVAVD